MREILFRAKDNNIKGVEWVYGFYVVTDSPMQGKRHFIYTGKIEYDKLSAESYFPTICSRHFVDPETVCQYIGLKDKNGRKIFEGDIVRYTDEVIGKEKVDEVKYNETHAAFCRLHKSEMGLQYLFVDEAVANKCEVIGNIFDNPELLGGEEGQ